MRAGAVGVTCQLERTSAARAIEMAERKALVIWRLAYHSRTVASGLEMHDSIDSPSSGRGNDTSTATAEGQWLNGVTRHEPP